MLLVGGQRAIIYRRKLNKNVTKNSENINIMKLISTENHKYTYNKLRVVCRHYQLVANKKGSFVANKSGSIDH